jgi:hypothetical protein
MLKYYRNFQDTKNCSLLLLRLGILKDIRIYIAKKYMYDYKCPTDAYFYSETRIIYSDVQTSIYELFKRHRINIIQMPNRRYGASMILSCIAKACCLAKINVCILVENEENEKIIQKNHDFMLGCELPLTLFKFQDFKFSNSNHVILLDAFSRYEELKVFLDEAISRPNVHVLATGYLDDQRTDEMLSKYPAGFLNYAKMVI